MVVSLIRTQFLSSKACEKFDTSVSGSQVPSGEDADIDDDEEEDDEDMEEDDLDDESD